MTPCFPALLLLALAGPPDPAAGLGETPGSRLAMKFEVTFMKFDVADVEAFLDPATAERLGEAIGGREWSGDLRRDLEAAMREDDGPFAVRMTLLRDAGLGRFLGGILGGLEEVREGGWITEAEEDSLRGAWEAAFAPLAERGVKKGDAYWSRVEGSSAHILHLDPGGEVQVEFTGEGEVWARAVRGLYFDPDSPFSEKLLRSRVEPRRE